MHRVYLDTNASAPVLPEVFAAMRPYFDETFGNASSIHGYGQQARAAVERARECVARLLHCRGAEVVFTSGGTEGDNLALFGLAEPGDHVITSSIEHSAIAKSCARLRELGCEVTEVPVDGRGLVVHSDDVRRALRADTKLITIMLANNETGVLQPIEEIGENCARGRYLVAYGRRAGRRQDTHRCGASRMRFADDLRAQNACPAGDRRCVRA